MRPRTCDLVSALPAAVLLASARLIAAGQDPPQQPPEFRSGVELVTVDVGVIDKQGQPLRGLVPADFTVTVGGRPRKVVSAEFVDVSAGRLRDDASDDGAGVSTNEGGGSGRLFAFVVDQSTLDTGSARRVAVAAARFVDALTLSDRSALVTLPVGHNIEFTWAHDRVKEGLLHVTGMASAAASWESGSLTEARDIANRGQVALRPVAERECGGNLTADVSTAAPQGSRPGGDTGGAGVSPESGTGGSTTGGSSGSRTRSSASGLAMSSCMRNLQMMAETTWRSVRMMSLTSLSALRQVIADLGRVHGDKTIILISGGWPLDDREEISLLSEVASDAAAARTRLFTVFVSASPFSVERRTMSPAPSIDQYMHQAPLENLASMSGGGSFRGDVGAEGVFDRLSRELGAYYRLGVEKAPDDADEKTRAMKVRVSRGDATVRAREFFDVRTYVDRDWTARLDEALDSPALATGVGIRVTSYLAAAQDGGGKVKLVMAGEASRVRPGPATLQILVRDLRGKKILAGEQALGELSGGALPFSANVALVPGSYIVRLAILDGEGRVGSVDHHVVVRPVTMGALAATGPMLVRVPSGAGAEPRFVVVTVGQDERLAMEVDIEGDKKALAETTVLFEVAASDDGPALVQNQASVSPGSREDMVLAQGVLDVRLFPPGPYVVRAKLKSAGGATGEVRRRFVVAGPVARADVAGAAATPIAVPTPLTVNVPSGAIQSFGVDQVLAPRVLGAFLDRAAARPDAASPPIRELIDRARSADVRTLVVPEGATYEGAVPAFLRGLALLGQNELDPAANAFRAAMRAAPDFYPAMVYLGACYAAGGKDKQAAGAWNTALIKEDDTAALHLWLTDALLRQGRAAEALEAIERARGRWPNDPELKRRFVAAALLAGRSADGLRALDELIAEHNEEEPLVVFGVLVLYESFSSGRPIDGVEGDRTRITRLAAAYRARGGPSQALIDTWVKAATAKR